MTEMVPGGPGGAADYRPIALVDLLDRVLGKGVVVSGELALSIADVDLVHVSLRALLASVRASAGAAEATSGAASGGDGAGAVVDGEVADPVDHATRPDGGPAW
ncbi:gas vesicle protein [Polymorphospora lycopeni]|uniref:Gas vesicle protein n=1 Tax=Polymorphospora lycopeni TaxID=3140240 RepID=A0ABV5CVY5_9ACTN